MDFKKWLENSGSPRKMLILIHPDCVPELGEQATHAYIQKLTTHAPLFDYVVVHPFLSGIEWLDRSTHREEIKQAYRDIYAVDQKIADVYRHDPRDMYSCTYSREVADYLVENPDTEVYMGGGYESNCLWIAYKKLFEKLGWLMSENKTKVTYYKPLIFAIRELGGIDRSYQYPPKKIQDYDKTWGDFHPAKVDYSEFNPSGQAKP